MQRLSHGLQTQVSFELSKFDTLSLINQIRNSGLIAATASFAAGVSITFPLKVDAANFSGLQSQICSGLSPGLFCVNDAINITKDWFYDAPRLNPLTYDGSWKSNPAGSNASGRRFWEVTDRSYQIDFQGRFDEVRAIGWNGNLLDQNASKVSGETIPTSWRSTNGYNLPASASVFNFSKDYKVSRTRLEKGELGCPTGITISHCTFVNAYIAASTDLGGQVSARGDITQIAAGVTESVIINAAILRNTKILINNNLQDTIATGIGNLVSELSVIEDGGLKPKDIKLNGKVKVEGNEKQVSFSGEGSIAADIIYEEDEEVASIFAKYLEEASSNYFNTGTSELIRLTLNDSIGMTADIRGIGFTAADVFTELRLQNPQSSAFTVFKVVEKVPGPLPLLGLGAFIGYSRKLRSRLKSSKKYF